MSLTFNARALGQYLNIGGAGMAQWWEHSPPTNVARVRFPALAPHVGRVCCWFSTLLREVFLRVLRFSPLPKNQHFQIPIRAGMHGDEWALWCSVGKQITNYKLQKKNYTPLSQQAFLVYSAAILSVFRSAHSQLNIREYRTVITCQHTTLVLLRTVAWNSAQSSLRL